MENPIVTFNMADGKTFKVELYPDIAPNTVNNFISLVKNNFYDGLIFHRVVHDFVIQAGCPYGTGIGGPGYNIKGEFGSNGFVNDLRHLKGVISMARAMGPNTAGSQFFICLKDTVFLDAQYAGFGKVIEGLDAVMEIGKVEVDSRDHPIEDQVIKSVTVDTKGVDYPEPETM